MDNTLDTIDLSGKKLKKLNKPTPTEAQATTLILDDNELQRLDNIDSYTKVQKLSAVRNQLLRMYGVCRLHLLHTLNLAHNGILTIEGLKELTNLKCLCLAGNSIKTIEHLNTNINLEHLDLSENSITHITDLSFLKNVKELLLHSNKIGHLRQCERYLPSSLVTLTLSNNNINDLNEISQLVHLTNLNSISIANNPCVTMTGNVIGFDYRPFIINWCMNVRVIDGYIVDAIESLRAEWLYSQGRGRHFRVGDQQELSQYLATVCPLTGEALETEEDRKLRIILSKAKHHQQQLRDQETNPESSTPSPATRKKLQGVKSSPRLHSSRLSNRSKSPERMSSSCYSNSSIINSPLMSQSLDPTLLSQSITPKSSTENTSNDQQQNGISEKCLDDISSPLQALSKLVPVPESLMSPDYRPSPLVGRVNIQSTTLSPPPNQRISSAKVIQPVRSPKPSRIATAKPKTPDNKRINHYQNQQGKVIYNIDNAMEKPMNTTPLPTAMKKSPSSEDESEICPSKLQTIQMKAEERRQQRDSELHSNSSGEDKTEQAAIYIQKMWRGYYTRNRNKYVQELFKSLQAQRAEQYIQKLATDMESTKVALESERKIQMLQMEAITALWKKVSALQPDGENSGINNTLNTSSTTLENTEIVKDLAQTCNMLHAQIQQLQGSMQDIIRFMSAFSQVSSINQQLKENAIATQTEISAVHTPQGEAAKMFPFQKQTRPSSLPLPVSQRGKTQNASVSAANQELKQFAGSLVDGVIKTVSETKADCIGTQTTEITVTNVDKTVEPEKLETESPIEDLNEDTQE
ncbi:hypothetical protein ILUMI_01227 [Ignelater luminosus]|uniref:Centrosomal protein of 97 kDa n=1 Tax=Ignelater luminosus TaxID=2038154 RepID=A0A8K0DIS0_IGNLU|nr:hypothetical protein ILUMI_01227 [Ignelater luminosus]